MAFGLDVIQTATAKEVSSIVVKSNTVKTDYIYGETFDPSNLIIRATYSNAYYPSEEISYTGNETDFVFDMTTRSSTLISTGTIDKDGNEIELCIIENDILHPIEIKNHIIKNIAKASANS